MSVALCPPGPRTTKTVHVLLSHKHKFIFIKTRKTGGSSTEMALARYCGPDDVITDQKEYHTGVSDLSAQNERLPYSEWSLGAKIKKLTGRPLPARGTGFYQHMMARNARKLIPPDIWNNYFKFTIERNPWDRQVSQYHWRYRNTEDPPAFRTFIMSPFRRKITRNWRMYTEADKLIVDTVIMHHDLQTGLESVLARLGIDGPVDLPTAKSGFRKQRDYRAYYDDDTRQMVGMWYTKEISEFGFQF